ncbi:MAG: hypothetical protein AAGA03_13395 [Planctomycetota bacterium]
MSTSGKFIAVSGWNTVSLLQANNGGLIATAEGPVASRFHSSLVRFTKNDDMLIAVGDGLVIGYELPSLAEAFRFAIPQEGSGTAGFATLRDGNRNELVVVRGGVATRYSLSGESGSNMSEGGDVIACASDAAGQLFAYANDDQVRILRGDPSLNALSIDFVATSALAFSRDGRKLVMGNLKGQLMMVDTLSGRRHWLNQAPAFHRISWTFFIALLALPAIPFGYRAIRFFVS